MLFRRQVLHVARMSVDIILLSIAFLLSLSQDHKLWPPYIFTLDYSFLFILIFIWLVSARFINLYDEFRTGKFNIELINLIKNIIVQFVASIIFIFMVKDGTYTRTFVVRYTLVLLILTGTGRYFLRTILVYFRKKGRNLRNILIIGAGLIGQKLSETITDNDHFGYRLIGFLDDEKKSFLNGKFLGPINNLESVISTKHIDEVIIALPNYAEDSIHKVISICENEAVRVRIIPDHFKFLSQNYSISMFGRFPIISVRDDRINQFKWRFLKRTFDTFFTLLLFIVIFSWLWPLIALIIKLDSKGPVFFRQERWRKNNKEFIVYKFRSMNIGSTNVDEDGKYQQARKDDPRITKIGRVLRKTNIDELPQFINVLKGEMSLVGPRPHPIPLNLQSKDNVDNYMVRHMAKPGITGWAQVNGYRGETKDPVLMQRRVEHDVWYIENWSFWLDIKIIFLTGWIMLKGDRNAY
jgi:putative colanic acid biosynthesis UDP-glucose lipid carrier transferase